MAHFAEIDDSNKVLRVVVVPNSEESRGQEYLSIDLSLGGIWIQCSYNNSIRKQFPGKGYTYDPFNDVFIAPQPYPSWSLNSLFDWAPPVPKPEVGCYAWDESVVGWVSE